VVSSSSGEGSGTIILQNEGAILHQLVGEKVPGFVRSIVEDRVKAEEGENWLSEKAFFRLRAERGSYYVCS